jgi:hypothetical protein
VVVVKMKEMGFDQDQTASAPDWSSPGVAGLAAEDAMDAARDGDLRRACILAGIAARYSEKYGQLLDTVFVISNNPPKN